MTHRGPFQPPLFCDSGTHEASPRVRLEMRTHAWLCRGSAARSGGGDPSLAIPSVSPPWPRTHLGTAPTHGPPHPTPSPPLSGTVTVAGGDAAQLLLAGDVTGRYSPYPLPGALSGSVFFPRELLNNLHPPRSSFWALFVKVNLQLAASGDAKAMAAPSLNATHGDRSGAARPAPARTRTAGPEQHRWCWGPSAHPRAAPVALDPSDASSWVLARREPRVGGCRRDKVSMAPPSLLLDWDELRGSVGSTEGTKRCSPAGASPPAPASALVCLPTVRVMSWRCSAPTSPSLPGTVGRGQRTPQDIPSVTGVDTMIDLYLLGVRLCSLEKGSCQGTGDSAGRGMGATREEDGARHSAARDSGTGLSWKRRGRGGRLRAQPHPRAITCPL